MANIPSCSYSDSSSNSANASESYRDAIIKRVKETYNEEIKTSALRFKEANITTQAATGQRLNIEVEVLRKAFNLCGDTIYDLDVENDLLKEQLKEYGDLDIDKMMKLMAYKKSNIELEEKNKRILSRLSQTMDKSRMIDKK